MPSTISRTGIEVVVSDAVTAGPCPDAVAFQVTSPNVSEGTTTSTVSPT